MRRRWPKRKPHSRGVGAYGPPLCTACVCRPHMPQSRRWDGMRPMGRRIECTSCAATIWAYGPQAVATCPECHAELPKRRDDARQPAWSCGKCGCADNWASHSTCRQCSGRAPQKVLDKINAERREGGTAKPKPGATATGQKPNDAVAKAKSATGTTTENTAEDDNDKKELEAMDDLKEDIAKITGVKGAEQLLANKEAELEKIQMQRRWRKKPSVQLRELEQKLGAKERASARKTEEAKELREQLAQMEKDGEQLQNEIATLRTDIKRVGALVDSGGDKNALGGVDKFVAELAQLAPAESQIAAKVKGLREWVDQQRPKPMDTDSAEQEQENADGSAGASGDARTKPVVRKLDGDALCAHPELVGLGEPTRKRVKAALDAMQG